MQAEAIETLQLHPIVALAWSVVDPYNPAPQPARLQRELVKLSGSDQLQPAVLSLVTVAKYLDDRGRSRDADTILSIAATATDALVAQKSTQSQRDCDRRRTETEAFSRFQGRDSGVHRAPKLGARALAGTITIAALQSGPRRA